VPGTARPRASHESGRCHRAMGCAPRGHRDRVSPAPVTAQMVYASQAWCTGRSLDYGAAGPGWGWYHETLSLYLAPPGVPVRILVVDDDPTLRGVLTEVLTFEAHEVRTAGNGAEALAVLPEFRPDVILLDVLMPVMGGREFIRAYQAMPGSHAPIVAMSVVLSPQSPRGGVAAQLTKPFDLSDLLAVLAEYAQAKIAPDGSARDVDA
jgi:CheY-like chemotaxis protein